MMNAILCSRKGCYNDFIKAREHQKYCCPQCRMKAWRDNQAGDPRIIKLEKRVEELEEKIENLEIKLDALGKYATGTNRLK